MKWAVNVAITYKLFGVLMLWGPCLDSLIFAANLCRCFEKYQLSGHLVGSDFPNFTCLSKFKMQNKISVDNLNLRYATQGDDVYVA